LFEQIVSRMQEHQEFTNTTMVYADNDTMFPDVVCLAHYTNQINQFKSYCGSKFLRNQLEIQLKPFLKIKFQPKQNLAADNNRALVTFLKYQSTHPPGIILTKPYTSTNETINKAYIGN
jgi:hypothetical protein